jgi:hypothetical protein
MITGFLEVQAWDCSGQWGLASLAWIGAKFLMSAFRCTETVLSTGLTCAAKRLHTTGACLTMCGLVFLEEGVGKWHPAN